MGKPNSSEILICFYSIVLLSVFRLTSSDSFDENSHEKKNIFLDPIKPYMEHCRTSRGEEGRCMPLNECPSLRDDVRIGGKHELLQITRHFYCSFRKEIYFCCPDPKALRPFRGIHELTQDETSHGRDDGSHHHHQHPPGFFPCDKEKPEFISEGYEENERNNRKVYEKPVTEEIDEGDDDEGGISEESGKKPDLLFVQQSGTQPSGGNGGLQQSSFHYSAGSGGVGFSVLKEPSVFASGTGQPIASIDTGASSYGSESSLPRPSSNSFGSDSLSRPSSNSFGSGSLSRPSSNSFGSGSLSRPSSNSFGSDGFSRPGSNTFGSGSLSRPSSNSFGSGGLSRPGSNSFGSGGLSRPGSNSFGGSNSQDFFVGNTDTQGTYNNQGFSSEIGSQGSLSGSRPPSYSSAQGLNGQPNQSGLNNQRPQTFGNQNPSNYESIYEGFGNERPSYVSGNERPNAGLNRPGTYDTQIGASSSGRPVGQGSKRPTNNQQGNFESGSTISSGLNNQRPNNQGSNKKPNRGASDRRRLLPDGKCGVELSDKIIGGENTQLDEFPWMALLHFATKGGQSAGYGCGGSLINERYVLTAAHCIKGASLPDNVIVKNVRLGEYDLTKERDCVQDVCSPKPLDVAVEEIIVHPEYKPNDKAQQHDIALIRLRKKVPFTHYVSPICLPRDELKRKDYSGKQMVVAGWGKTSNGVKAKSSAIKQKVSLPFVTLDNCKPFYESINIRLRNTQMCAGGERAKDSCQGDSGGPLMTNDVIDGQSSWFVHGIVSFGPENCGLQNIAGVYTKVSQYEDWILDNIKE